jgi:ribose 1,5-bisphosphokinase PhnN
MKVREQLLKLAAAVTCLLDDCAIPFASLPSAPVSQFCFPLRSPEVRHYFYGAFEKEHNAVLAASAYRDLLRTLESQARESKLPRRALHTRIAADGPRFAPHTIYLNLANETGDALEITATGWNIRPAKPAYFRGSSHSLPLPEPAPDGPSLHSLLDTLTALPAAVCEPCADWLASSLRPTGPYPILVLKGPSGSGKSTLARLLRLTLDPCVEPLPNLPNTSRQIQTYAEQHHVLVFDHVTHITRQQSQALCCTTRPIILTVPDRLKLDPEIAGRAVVVELPEIQPAQRRTEADMATAFNHLHPQLLGALCALISQALAGFAETKLAALPRHADAAHWIAAAQAIPRPEHTRASFLPLLPDRSPIPADST